ncbi:unnamed protein product [Cuscuta epithymum]|uniref:Uncharacterized protein n=1 Tax=Cuscuta epithymum TaxID=186058 RepID=A0AAV0FVF9_9ASTE|nr:unnamed protein product [Cuscuta epithymum]
MFSVTMERIEWSEIVWTCLLLLASVVETITVMAIFGWNLAVLFFFVGGVGVFKCSMIVLNLYDRPGEEYKWAGRGTKCAEQIFSEAFAIALRCILPLNIGYAVILACWSLYYYGWRRVYLRHYDIGAWEVFVSVPMQLFMYSCLSPYDTGNDHDNGLSGLTALYGLVLPVLRYYSYAAPELLPSLSKELLV